MGEQIKKEIAIMKTLRHPNIIQLKEVLASATTIYLVLELVEGGELFNVIVEQGKLEEDGVGGAREYFRQLVSGLAYCFPASDTRVLTNRGMLFLEQIQTLQGEGGGGVVRLLRRGVEGAALHHGDTRPPRPLRRSCWSSPHVMRTPGGRRGVVPMGQRGTRRTTRANTSPSASHPPTACSFRRATWRPAGRRSIGQ